MLSTKTETKYVDIRRRYKLIDINPVSGEETLLVEESIPLLAFASQNVRTTGSNYPDWRRRLIVGDECTTHLSGSKRRNEVPDGFAMREVRHKTADPNYGPRTAVEWTGCLAMPQQFAAFDASLVQPSDNLAKQRFVKRILKSQKQMSALVSLGELGETLRMLKNPAKLLRTGITDYVRTVRRRVRRVKPKHKPRLIRDTWLEYSFGWVPLISDIGDAREALAKLGEFAPFVRVDGTGEISSSDSAPRSETISHLTIDFEELRKSTCIVVYRGVVDVQVDENGIRLARQNFGFDWQEFVPTIWELIPYSFLVDYFTNIGEVLTALTLNTSRVRWMAKTVVQQRETSARGISLRKWTDTDNVVIRESFLPGYPTEISQSQVVRDRYLGSLVPDFQVEIPGIGNVHKWLNLAALLRLRSL